MGKYFNAGLAPVSFIADEDLTAYQWHLMMAASTEGYCQLLDQIAPGNESAGSGRMPIGVLTNSPSMGQEAAVKVVGFTKAKASVSGCWLGNGSFLTASNLGQFRSASDDDEDPIWGIWFGPDVTSGSAIGNVLLNMSFVASGLQLLNTIN
jgi:hypothetical protein